MGTPEAAPQRDTEDPVMAASGEHSEICQRIAGIVNAQGVPAMPQWSKVPTRVFPQC
jgi:hypothetical protein